MIRLMFLGLALMTCVPSTYAGRFDKSESLAEYKPVLSNEFKQLLKKADFEAGKAFFDRKCSQCHDHEKSGGHSKGPLLWNVMGRKAGYIPGFDFSDAMKKPGHIWNYATLNYYLTRTDRAVPGRTMNFRGIKKDARRANLLLYLRTLNDNPPPLP